MIRSSTTTNLALLGGVYSNYLALQAACEDARWRGVDRIYCLGDMGGFGPFPDRVFPLLDQYNVVCIQGNYDHSIGNQLDDCQCGYADPRDNYFAGLSYDYTLRNTSESNRAFLRQLSGEKRLELNGVRMLLCHGSPRKTNEFLWESTTSTAFLEMLCERYEADLIAATHTGIKWTRALRRDRLYVNVGVIGRPENDGTQNVWYTLVKQRAGEPSSVEFVPVHYDYQRLARDMRDERLPDEFVETIVTGWWTTCLEVLPSKERRRGRH